MRLNKSGCLLAFNLRERGKKQTVYLCVSIIVMAQWTAEKLAAIVTYLELG